MIVAWSDFFAILLIALYLIGTSLAWWLPLAVWWKNSQQAFQWSMPVSWSVQILIGYVFYSAGGFLWFMPLYFGVMLIINIFALVGWSYRRERLIRLPKYSSFSVLLGLFATAVMVYVRLYDPLHTLAPGNNDTANHLGFLYDLYRLGHLSNPYYAPGYHLFLGILTTLLDQVAIYRWVGPISSIVLAGGIYLFVRQYITQPIIRWVYLIGTGSYLFYQWVLQTMSLFSSALTFLYFVAFLALLIQHDMSWRRRLGLFSLLGLALAVTVPYFFIQFFFVIFALFIISCVWRQPFSWKRCIVFMFIVVLCIGVAVGHVYLQTKVLHRGGSFPEIPIITNENNEVLLISNFDDSVTEDPNNGIVVDQTSGPSASDESVVERAFGSAFFDRLQQFTWYQQMRPMILTIMDVFSFKQIRPANTLLNIGAYAWFVIAIVMLVSGLKTRSPLWIVVAVASIIYGFVIQTGSLELSFYRGRSGWYLLWLALFGIVVIFERYYRPAWKWPILVAGFITAIWAVTHPPMFYRPYYREVFDASWLSIDATARPRLFIISRQHLLGLMYPSAVILPYDVPTLLLPDSASNRYLIFEKDFYTVDPVLSQQGLNGDADYSVFYEQQTMQKAAFDQTSAAMQSSPQFTNYTAVWQNDHIVIYQWKRP